MEVNPSDIAKSFREEIAESITKESEDITLVGLLAIDSPDAKQYSKFMRVGCEAVGINYDERLIKPDDLENQITHVNEDPAVTAVIVYYPIFSDYRDADLRKAVSPLKDVEGLHPFWLKHLYANVRHIEHSSGSVKALLPCTPLAIVKVLEALGVYRLDEDSSQQLIGKSISIFNRSEVVGRPLAHMLSNDGARVYSFDIHGVVEFAQGKKVVSSSISRAEALGLSDVVITGVPSDDFEKISAAELDNVRCGINFSYFENFEESAPCALDFYVPRVGPVTVAMCLRNALRMKRSYAGIQL